MKYTQEELNNILAQVETEFSSLLNKAEEEAASIESQEEIAEEAQTEQPAEVTEEVAEEVEQPAEEATSHEYTDEDIQEVEGLYADMDKSEAEIHYKALKKAMGENIAPETETEVKVEEVAKNEDVEETQTEDLNKAEILAKDEKIAEQSAKIEKMESTIGQLTDALSQFLGHKKTAKRKAINGLNYQTIAKSEEKNQSEVDVKNLSKSEITSKLNEVTRTNISSQDRQLINEYYCNNGSVESIGHLLK